MKTTLVTNTTLVAAAVLLLSGQTARPADVQENWTKNCVSCHGKDGKGQTKAGRMAEVKDLTDPAVQSAFTDAEILKQIKEGLKDKEGKKFRMKPFADKFKEEEIKALVAHVRSLKRK